MSDYPRTSLQPIMDAYYTGGTEAQIVARMTAVIQGQMDRGVYISPHLTGRGIDVRTRDLSVEQRDVLQRIAAQEGVRVHPEGRPPHLHLTFPPEPRLLRR